MFFNNLALLGALAGTSMAGTLLWDGRFNDYASSAELDNWSWSNQVGEYQWYIHGSGKTTEYVNFSSDFANPADTSSKQGAKITIDDTSSWNGQTMMRSELIPQTSAAINKGKKFYHFSIKHTDTNAPDSGFEHQVAFFESHFTELKLGSADSSLQWYADSTSQWNTTFDAGTWHNIAYGIDFDAGTVEFYHSTGADDLTLTAGPVDVTASSDGKDWHVGVLRLASTSGTDTSNPTEDWYFSGVYIEEGDITTSVVGPSNGTSTTGSTSTSAVASSAVVSSSSVTATPSAAVPSQVSAQAAVVSTSSSSSAIVSAVSSSSASTSSSAATATATASATANASVPTTLQTIARSSSAAVSSAVSSAAPASTSAPATYACNPAHAYPNGQSCISTNGSLTLVSPATTASSEAAAIPTGDSACAVEYVYV